MFVCSLVCLTLRSRTRPSSHLCMTSGSTQTEKLHAEVATTQARRRRLSAWQVITMVRHQRRDVWAKMQLDRRKKQEEKATASEARQRRGGCGARGRSDESPEEVRPACSQTTSQFRYRSGHARSTHSQKYCCCLLPIQRPAFGPPHCAQRETWQQTILPWNPRMFGHPTRPVPSRRPQAAPQLPLPSPGQRGRAECVHRPRGGMSSLLGRDGRRRRSTPSTFGEVGETGGRGDAT